MKYACNISFEIKIPDGYKLNSACFKKWKQELKRSIQFSDVGDLYVVAKNDDGLVYPSKVKMKFEKIK